MQQLTLKLVTCNSWNHGFWTYMPSDNCSKYRLTCHLTSHFWLITASFNTTELANISLHTENIGRYWDHLKSNFWLILDHLVSYHRKLKKQDVESVNIESLNIILPSEERNGLRMQTFSIKASLVSRKHNHQTFQPDPWEYSQKNGKAHCEDIFPSNKSKISLLLDNSRGSQTNHECSIW